MPAASSAVLLASAFVGALGINTHIDFEKYGYENLQVVEDSLKYLGLHHVRDSAEKEIAVQSWSDVARSAHVKFDDFIPEGGPQDMENGLRFIPRLASQGILEFIEGPNEEDDPVPLSKGNTIAAAAAFQHKVREAGRAAGLPVINLSFGSGWTAANNWHGNYDKVGDLSADCDFANAHIYPPASGAGQPGKTIRRLTPVAKLAAASRPVIATEMGWKANTADEDTIARAVVSAALDASQNDHVKMYFYALFDDMSGKFGLMNSDGTPRASGRALHNLTTLLDDTDSGSFTPRPLPYGLAQTSGAENTLLIQKSDGSHWLAVWDETDSAHNVTLNLQTPAALDVFDPVNGTEPVQSMRGTSSVSFNLGAHPLLIKIVGAGT